MTTKFTPGPWEADTDNVEVLYVKSKDGNICEIYIPNITSDGYYSKCKANLDLIAAAPELFKACKAIFNNKKCLLEVDEVKLLCKAIKKAEGK